MEGKQTKLFKIPLIITFGILAIGVLYCYLNYQFPKIKPTQSIEEIKKTEEKSVKSIQLEKPPFIKE